jgi:hypothetical protein
VQGNFESCPCVRKTQKPFSERGDPTGKRLRDKLFSVFLRWYDPDQVQGCDLSPDATVLYRDTPNGKTIIKNGKELL